MNDKNQKTTLVIAGLFAVLSIPMGMSYANADNADIREGLVAYYTFDEVQGNMIDQSNKVELSQPSNADFTNHNVDYGTDGLIGKAYSYNGNNAYSQVPRGTLDDPITTGSFTYNTWIKSNQLPDHASGLLFTRGYVSAGGVYGLTSSINDGYLSVGRHVGAGYDHVKSCANRTDLMNPSDEWQMYSITYDKQSGIISLYINGQFCSSETKSTKSISYNSRYDNGFTFAGYNRNVSNSYSSMLVDETSIFNTVKSTDEISSLYNSGKGLNLIDMVQTPPSSDDTSCGNGTIFDESIHQCVIDPDVVNEYEQQLDQKDAEITSLSTALQECHAFLQQLIDIIASELESNPSNSMYCGLPESSYDSVVRGDDNPNTLAGTSGNDLILGFAGSDTINGYEGNDCIIGGAGVDIIDGSHGQDTCVDSSDDVVASCEILE